MNFSQLIFLISMFVGVGAQAQDTTDAAYCNKLKVDEIQWLSIYDQEMVKVRKGNKWGVYSLYQGFEFSELEYDEIVPLVYDSLGDIYEKEYSIAKFKGKYGVLPDPINNKIKPNKLNFNYDALVIDSLKGRSYIYVRQNNKWGLIHKTGYEMIAPVFSNRKDVPKLWLEEWYIEQHLAVSKRFKADVVVPDGGNGDGVFKYRDAETKKWGMVQYFSKNQYTQMIPAAFDSVRFFPFNANYTAVYNNGKVGMYLATWSYDDKDTMHSVPCIYDDYKRYTADGVPKLAMKKGGNWGWVNWLTGKPMSEFIYETTDDLPYPHYKQRMY